MKSSKSEVTLRIAVGLLLRTH